MTADTSSRTTSATSESSVSGSSSPGATATGKISLSRSRQSWTGAGSAAGFVLRYLAPMRRLLTDMLGNATDADEAMAILIQHLVKSGYGDHKQGRLRDFLIRGMRSAARAQVQQVTAQAETLEAKRKSEAEKAGTPYFPASTTKPTLDLDIAELQSPKWIAYWRDGLLERAWRALERHQHEARHRVTQGDAASEPDDALNPSDQDDLVFDVLNVSMHHAGDSPQVLAGRVAGKLGRSVSEAEFRRQLEPARVLFAQFLADEVSHTLDDSDPKRIGGEIKTLGLQKAFEGVRVRP
ncbi:MAG: hypothetical protein AAF745_02890 [Planctomycetota bacterium]